MLVWRCIEFITPAYISPLLPLLFAGLPIVVLPVMIAARFHLGDIPISNRASRVISWDMHMFLRFCYMIPIVTHTYQIGTIIPLSILLFPLRSPVVVVAPPIR